jgi:hypothetical protein
MKRKNIFIAAAFILAIGSAFTSRPVNKKPLTLFNGYLVGSCSTVAIQCDNRPGVACKVSGAQAYSDINSCTIPLTKSIQ